MHFALFYLAMNAGVESQRKKPEATLPATKKGFENRAQEDRSKGGKFCAEWETP
jgi:hypothetical protein